MVESGVWVRQEFAKPVATRGRREYKWSFASILPKGIDVSRYTQRGLDAVADALLKSLNKMMFGGC